MYPPLSLTKSFNNHLADISMVVTVHCDLGQLRNLIEDPDINVHFLFPFFRQQRSLRILLKLSSASTLMSAFFSFLSSVSTLLQVEAKYSTLNVAYDLNIFLLSYISYSIYYILHILYIIHYIYYILYITYYILYIIYISYIIFS